MHHPKLEDLVRRDGHYPIEAYEFVGEAIKHSLRPTGGHFRPGQLLRSLPELARREFGMLAPTVFQAWNVRRTADVGRILANLIDVGLLTAGPEDGDLPDDFDLAAALGGGYRIDWPRERLER